MDPHPSADDLAGLVTVTVTRSGSEPAALTLTVLGELDIASMPLLLSELDRVQLLLQPGSGVLRVRLDRAEFVDATSLMLLLERQGAMSRRGQVLELGLSDAQSRLCDLVAAGAHVRRRPAAGPGTAR